MSETDRDFDTGKVSRDRSVSIVERTRLSFVEEQRGLLQTRCRLVYVLGTAVAGAVHLFYVGFGSREVPIETALTPWMPTVFDLHVASFALAALLVYARRWSMHGLLTIDLTLFTLNILLSQFHAVAFDLNKVPIFAIALLLFLHASFIPVRMGAQAGLALVGGLGFAVMSALGYALIPELEEFWQANRGAAALRSRMLEGTFQLGLLAVVSVAITKTLYHMRLSLHEAKRLGNYVIERALGQGGMGDVYLAEHAFLRRPTALKVLTAPPGGGEAWLARFEREARLSATLSHPNTITIYDYGRAGSNTFYYAMEYLKGWNLEELVRRVGPIPPARTVFILRQICGSLAEAHENGIMHRDIKPSNVLLSCRGGLYDFVKVLDFGLAKYFEPPARPGVTKAGLVLGTPLYMAPEVASGSNHIDGRADLYGLGGIAYWMLVGRPPFEATTNVALMLEHLQTVPSRPGARSELPIPEELDGIVMRCLEKDPLARFQTAGEVEESLRAIRLEEEWTAERARAWWTTHGPDVFDSVAVA